MKNSRGAYNYWDDSKEDSSLPKITKHIKHKIITEEIIPYEITWYGFAIWLLCVYNGFLR